MAVLQDYSYTLTLEDIDYNQISRIKVYKMQLLEHLSLQKWILWSAIGKLQDQDDTVEYDASNFKINEEEFFNR